MPPKKKDDKAALPKDSEPNEEDKELLEKELVISYLKMKLVGYQDLGEQLQVDNFKLSKELELSKTNLKDINEFLTNELKARALANATLERRVEAVQQELAECKAENARVVSELEENHESVVTELTEKLVESNRQAHAAAEYLNKRQELVKELQEVRETLKHTSRDYEDQISNLERQHVQDRDAWKRTMASRIQETKQMMMKLTDNQLEMTTKRTIVENEQMSAEMAYQSRQTSKLLERNHVLESEVAGLKRSLLLSRETEDELAKRNTIYQNTIKELLTKLKVEDEIKIEERDYMCGVDGHVSDLEAEVRVHRMTIEEQEAELQSLRRKVDEREHSMQQLRASVDDTADFLLRCLQDIKERVVTVETNNSPHENHDISVLPGKLTDLNAEQRERALSYLLEKLYIIQGADCSILGAAHADATGSKIVLPPIQQRVAPAAPLSSHRHTAAKTGVAPRFGASAVPPGDAAGAREAAGSQGAVSVGVQTCRPDLQPADDLLRSLLADASPWGVKAADNPVASVAFRPGKSWRTTAAVSGVRKSLPASLETARARGAVLLPGGSGIPEPRGVAAALQQA